MLRDLEPRSPDVQPRINVSIAEDFHVSRWESSLITFNDRSTKVYVFRMQTRFEGVALPTAGNLTKGERKKNPAVRVVDQKNISQGFPVLSLCTPRIQADPRRKGALSSVIG